MGDRKDAMDGGPKARGGPRRSKPVPESQLAGIRPYNFKPGAPSPNPGGRPRQHREAVAYLRERMDGVLEAMIDIVRRGKNGKLTVSDRILSQHLEFIWQAAFGKHPQSVLLAGNLDVVNPEDAGGLTALLARARLESERRVEHRAPRLGPVGPSSKPDFIVDAKRPGEARASWW